MYVCIVCINHQEQSTRGVAITTPRGALDVHRAPLTRKRRAFETFRSISDACHLVAHGGAHVQ